MYVRSSRIYKIKVYLPDPRLRTTGDVNAFEPDAALRGGGRLSVKSGCSPAPVGSRTSPWDATRVGVRGGKLWGCEGDSGGMPGDGGAMRPSAPRDEARRSPGMKPNIRRKSEERLGCGRCAEIGKEAATEGLPESTGV